jgi:hypothetical protein
MKASGK